MNRDTINNMIKYLVILLGSIITLFIILSFFRIGLVFWFYDKIFDWVSMRLGFDYYLALFVSISTTVLFWASFPYLAWTFLVGRKVYTSSIIMLNYNLTYGMSTFDKLLIIIDEKKFNHENNMMEKTELLEIIKKLLKTDVDLDFLLNLPESDLEKLVVCIRERFDQLGKQTL